MIVHWIQFFLVGTYRDIATTRDRPFEVLVSSVPCWAFEYTQGWVLSDPQGKGAIPLKYLSIIIKTIVQEQNVSSLHVKFVFFACSLWSTRYQ